MMRVSSFKFQVSSWRGAGGALLCVALTAAVAWGGAAARAETATPQKKVGLNLYVMSQCPFGTKAEDTILPAVKSLAPAVDFNLYYIANEQPGADGKAAFTSLHGQGEVDENIRQLCVQKHYPTLYMDFILERNTNIRDPNWQPAAKKVGADPNVISACAAGPEGAALLSDSIKGSQSRQANASPTIDINGAQYSGSRSLRSVTLALCDAMTAQGMPLPGACDQAKALPPDPVGADGNCGPGGAPARPPVAFPAQVVVDGESRFGQATLLDAIKNAHPAVILTTVASNTPEGRALIKQYHVETLPFYLIDKKVEQDPNFNTLAASFYIKTGDRYSIRPGETTYTPTVQLRRERVPHHLDLFVEGLSPFGAQAEFELMRYLQEHQPKELTFSIHYVVQETAKADATVAANDKGAGVRSASLSEVSTAGAGPLTSRRGEAELQEDLRQVCLFQHASVGTFFTYLNCRNQNLLDPSRADTCLQMTEPVSRCLTGGEGERLLRQDATLVRELGITGAPLILWANRYGPFGWHEVDWRELIAGKE